MSARPGQWELLGYDSDPVPGSPYDVLDEGLHYSGVASTIQEQILRLRRLAEPDEALVGHYADELTGACNDLADHLGQIEDRFRITGSELRAYEDDLETARTGTKRALDDAEAAKQQMDANAPVDQPPGAEEPTQAEEDAAEARAGRYSAGSTALGEAKSAATGVMSTFNDRAEAVARTIRDASDDDMKDSGWDKFKGAVGSIASVLDGIADVLGWIATALVIAALFIPGVNLLVAAAILLVSLGIHVLLAATDNGSWLDVAFDVVGLLTLGIGSTALTAAKAGRAATLVAAGRSAGRAASAQTLSRASFNGGRGLIGRAHSSLLRNFSTTVRANMRTAYDDAFRTMTQRSLPNATLSQAMRAGVDRSLASLAKDHRLLTRELGEAMIDPAYTKNLQLALTATRTGAVADALPKAMNPKVGDWWEGYEFPPYGDLSDSLKITIGGPF